MGGGLGALAAIVSLDVVTQEGQEGTYQWGRCGGKEERAIGRQNGGKEDNSISISGIQHDHMALEFQWTCA